MEKSPTTSKISSFFNTKESRGRRTHTIALTEKSPCKSTMEKVFPIASVSNSKTKWKIPLSNRFIQAEWIHTVPKVQNVYPSTDKKNSPPTSLVYVPRHFRRFLSYSRKPKIPKVPLLYARRKALLFLRHALRLEPGTPHVYEDIKISPPCSPFNGNNYNGVLGRLACVGQVPGSGKNQHGSSGQNSFRARVFNQSRKIQSSTLPVGHLSM